MSAEGFKQSNSLSTDYFRVPYQEKTTNLQRHRSEQQQQQQQQQHHRRQCREELDERQIRNRPCHRSVIFREQGNDAEDEHRDCTSGTRYRERYGFGAGGNASEDTTADLSDNRSNDLSAVVQIYQNTSGGGVINSPNRIIQDIQQPAISQLVSHLDLLELISHVEQSYSRRHLPSSTSFPVETTATLEPYSYATPSATIRTASMAPTIERMEGRDHQPSIRQTVWLPGSGGFRCESEQRYRNGNPCFPTESPHSSISTLSHHASVDERKPSAAPRSERCSQKWSRSQSAATEDPSYHHSNCQTLTERRAQHSASLFVSSKASKLESSVPQNAADAGSPVKKAIRPYSKRDRRDGTDFGGVSLNESQKDGAQTKVPAISSNTTEKEKSLEPVFEPKITKLLETMNRTIDDLKKQKEKEDFIIFVHILLRNLHKYDRNMKECVIDVIDDCHRRRERNEQGYESLVEPLRSLLEAVVSRRMWKHTECHVKKYLKRMELQRRKEVAEGTWFRPSMR